MSTAPVCAAARVAHDSHADLPDSELARHIRALLHTEDHAVQHCEHLAGATANPLAHAVLEYMADARREQAQEFERLLGTLRTYPA